MTNDVFPYLKVWLLKQEASFYTVDMTDSTNVVGVNFYC